MKLRGWGSFGSIKTTPSLLQQADINSHDAFNLLLSLWLDPSLLSEVGAQCQSSFKKVNYFASQCFFVKGTLQFSDYFNWNGYVGMSL